MATGALGALGSWHTFYHAPMLAIIVLLADLLAMIVGVTTWRSFDGAGCSPAAASSTVAGLVTLGSLALSAIALIQTVAENPKTFAESRGSMFPVGIALGLLPLLTTAATLTGHLAAGSYGECGMSRALAVWGAVPTLIGFTWSWITAEPRYARWWVAPLACEAAILLYATLTLRHWAVLAALIAAVASAAAAWRRHR